MLREGRLGKKIEREVAEYTSSLEFDRNIFKYDILNDTAHVVMLVECGIIPKKDASLILKGLKNIRIDLEPEHEDVHTAVEAALTKKIGEAAGKMHTARSRNDQIACDLRMWARDEINEIASLLIKLLRILLEISAENKNTVIPGYTHLQQAQPTTLAHHFSAHCDALLRDLERFEDCYKRVNLNPLGACALAGTSFPINRERTTQLLGFDGLIENSMDAVASRDFLLEALSALSVLMANLSRLAEELILWSTLEFGFVELSDDTASTSSIMPQKKNPDALEIFRAKAGRVIGNFTSASAILKSLPYSYNRDFQELNPIAFDSFSTARRSISILTKVVKKLKINKEKMLAACSDFITATDLADFIARECGIPFRAAHQIVGSAVSEALKKNKAIDSKLLNKTSKKIARIGISIDDEKIKNLLSAFESVKSRSVIGGPSPEEVKKMINARKALLSKKLENLNKRIKKIEDSKKLLENAMARIIKGA